MSSVTTKKCEGVKADDGFFSRIIHGRFSIKKKKVKPCCEKDYEEPNENVSFINKEYQFDTSLTVEPFDCEKMNPSPGNASALDSIHSLSSFTEGCQRPLCASTPKTGGGESDEDSSFGIRYLWRKIFSLTTKKSQQRKGVLPNGPEVSPLLP